MECPFCNKTKLKKEIVEEWPNFYLAPALGSFLPYYFLLISNNHSDSLSQTLNKENLKEFLDLKKKVHNFIFKKTNKEPVCFEYGACYNQKAGGCISHAHLHILPFDKALLPKVMYKLGKPNKVRGYLKFINLSKNLNSYLSLEEKGEIYIWKDPVIISQYIRKIIAEELHLNTYDWRKYPFYDVMKKSISEWNAQKEI